MGNLRGMFFGVVVDAGCVFRGVAGKRRFVSHAVCGVVGSDSRQSLGIAAACKRDDLGVDENVRSERSGGDIAVVDRVGHDFGMRALGVSSIFDDGARMVGGVVDGGFAGRCGRGNDDRGVYGDDGDDVGPAGLSGCSERVESEARGPRSGSASAGGTPEPAREGERHG